MEHVDFMSNEYHPGYKSLFERHNIDKRLYAFAAAYLNHYSDINGKTRSAESLDKIAEFSLSVIKHLDYDMLSKAMIKFATEKTVTFEKHYDINESHIIGTLAGGGLMHGNFMQYVHDKLAQRIAAYINSSLDNMGFTLTTLVIHSLVLSVSEMTTGSIDDEKNLMPPRDARVTMKSSVDFIRMSK